MSTPTPQQVLDTPLPDDNDSGADTIRDYLIALLTVLWSQGSDFSGKRPFGNSGWDWDLYGALVKACLIEGDFDEDGYLEDCDEDQGNRLIAKAILALAEPAGAA